MDNVREYYDRLASAEWERLVKDAYHGLEFRATMACLHDHLPAEGTVLDAGGGPGRYAIELCHRGYTLDEPWHAAHSRMWRRGGAPSPPVGRSGDRPLPRILTSRGHTLAPFAGGAPLSLAAAGPRGYDLGGAPPADGMR